MMEYYRYISHSPEVFQVISERKVLSTNPTYGFATWYSPTRYDDPLLAQQKLALGTAPSHRMGPISDDKLPVAAHDIQLRSVAPKYGQPGGGMEMRTKQVVWLPGLWDLNYKTWNL